MIVCAGDIENFSFAKPIGIGLVNSAINLTNILTTNLLTKQNISQLVFIGTAGLYKDGNIFDIYESSKASNLEISNVLNLSYSPIKYTIDNNVSRETLLVNSSNFITQDENIAYKMFELGCFMENIEFFSVLKVADFFKIPAFGIFCATNFCNKNAHSDFIKNHEKAKKILTSYIKNKGII
ncbi:purine nucleoside phosphorylase [Campylobacter sputorum subsp. bubulus]|uniref:Purine nucleoside phosphorylase n=1 Tax=Campylobacter sputorum subsp. sputorum TaxID=32024 RepID=A0A381DJP6_9BACT|nr:purine-nucleoside phosphorylase [Campylobacter sputorum]ASM35928.1 putative nucleoside phosphorylase [Campylobacter sputorum aubsp. sputorum RM3237]KAB0582338.1 purine-nucleoside phosphorylase [Campylobacter sputorum subsp. sputorum]QEL06118.1 putative nucleoside phosphorylase [Campylobacter sputorum subsp. sputorum]SUX09231.1 purine nucleoside phosphorylase [Campylobacter sputorum subsp. bubulus]SUX10922.1 purine nucleoside phosphorylase [Campylobacter sputorum subsp. sputorum]